MGEMFIFSSSIMIERITAVDNIFEPSREYIKDRKQGSYSRKNVMHVMTSIPRWKPYFVWA